MRRAALFLALCAAVLAEEDLVAKAAGGRVVHASWGSPKDLDALIDGDAATACSLPGEKRLPCEVTLAFPHDRVGDVARVVLSAPDGKKDSRARDVEVLASIDSATAGFASVGEFALEDRGGAQTLDVPDLPVKFLRIRVLTSHGGSKTLLSGIEVIGAFPPEETYVVSEMDAKRYEAYRKARAAAPSLDVKRTPLEERLFADAKDGKLDDLTLDEAAFVACGVADEAGLAKYRAQVDGLAEKARGAIGGGDARTRGKALLEWLHKNGLKRYRSHATDLTQVVDKGEFNCISSATLYNAVGQRLGLDLRVIEVPDHAFSILYDGEDGLDVETTTPRGFDPVRDKTLVAELEKQMGVVYIPDKHSKQRREVRDVGAVAIVYYNRGVGLSEDKAFTEAFACYAKALDLDPGFSGALHNLVQGHVRWAYELGREKEYEKAIGVLDQGLSIDPACEGLRQNLIASFTRWGLEAVEGKRFEEAVSIFEKAIARDPACFYYTRNLRYAFGQWALDRSEKEGPEKGLETIQTALARYPGDKDLLKARVALYDAWAKRLAKEKKWEEALDVYGRALAASPGDKLLAHNRVVVRLDWSKELNDSGKREEAIQVMKEGLAEDPKERAFKQNITFYYNEWAKEAMDRKDWKGAIAIYDKGLADLPGDSTLKQNRKYCEQQLKK
ncbi:MAG: hypothetical protein AAB434_04005 [Planctomycetota bacterium]